MPESSESVVDINAMRHSAAHLLAAALTKLYPGIKLGVGPVVDNGFFYDVDLPEPISSADFGKIEKTMRELQKHKLPYIREELSLEQARALMTSLGQDYKLQLLDDIEKFGSTKLDEQEAATMGGQKDGEMPTITVYHTGDFVDLCRGPHVEDTGKIGAFKLYAIAGAYWRGDDKNKMLQRIYGYCFATKEELDAHVTMMAEAEKRDHRKLGKELGLFTLINEIGPGLPLFYPKGALLRRLIEGYITEEQEKRGYLPIWIPHITRSELYKISGHLDKYDAMYSSMVIDEEEYYLKPMNCPHFMMLYKTIPHSYRELPLRYTCTTTNYRYEKSGELSGLTRVRSLTQDDCHVFCTPDQIEGEISLMLEMIGNAYKAFGMSEFWVRISLRDSQNKAGYLGDDAVWQMAEDSLRRVVTKTGWQYKEAEGEAAFYGPKLDFMLKDAIGREWQLSTIQLDFNLPQRFELEYTEAGGEKSRPVVIHRAILGSTERFMGILIEHFAGAFPVWLAPVQVILMSVGLDHHAPCQEFATMLRAEGIRVEVDDSNESMGKKIRNAEKSKVPYMIVIGDKEKELQLFAVRRRGSPDTVEITRDAFIEQVKDEITTKAV